MNVFKVFKSDDEVIVCNLSQEKECMEAYFADGLGRTIEDYEQFNIAGPGIMVEIICSPKLSVR